MDLNIKEHNLFAITTDFVKKKLKFHKGLKAPSTQAAISSFLTKYKECFKEVNRVVCIDINQGRKISIIDHSLPEDSRQTLDTYVRDLNTLNIDSFFEAELETVLGASPADYKEEVKQFFHNWHIKNLQCWDEGLEKQLLANMDGKHKEKFKLQFGIYNFTDYTIPEADYNLLKNGKKVVVPMAMSSDEKRDRINSDLLNYCQRYRRFFEGNETILAENDNTKEWLRSAAESSYNSEAKNFYNSVHDSLANVEDSLPVSHGVTKSQLVSRLDYPGMVWNESDKGRGIALFTSNQMRKAEEDCIKEMRGIRIETDKESLEASIRKEIDQLYQDLDGQQKWLVNTMFGDLQDKNKETIIPFLNLESKVHKLSYEDILSKNFGKLSFRPVMDQSRWVLNKISKSFMALITSVNEQLLATPTLSKFKLLLPKNGAEVSSYFKDFQFEKTASLKSIILADLSNAYSNISLADLEAAIEIAGEFLDMDSWKVELLICMARVILTNNFVQTSQGTFLLQKCLAMGNSASGACLTLTGLTSEYQKLSPTFSPGLHNILTPSAYFRYLDDTKGIIEGDSGDNIKETIMNIGTMFPTTIPINIDLFSFCGSFLDITTVRKLSSYGLETIMKKNFSSPPGYIPYISAVPNQYKHSALKSEMIRIRRTCSKPIFIWLLDKLLLRELNSLVHKGAATEMSKYKNFIKSNYDDNMVRKEKEKDCNIRVWGATCRMEVKEGTHATVMKILKEALGDSEANLPTIVPSTNLKEVLTSRRRYMAKLS